MHVSMDLTDIVKAIRSYEGIYRKKIISQVYTKLPVPPKNILAHFGEDCAVISHSKDKVLLLACDGIMESIVNRNPWWAGYCSVLVNANDIAAMGGKPLAMVNVISTGNMRVLDHILRGMSSAVLKFGIPMVGGHTHPDVKTCSVSVSILGIIGKYDVIYSHTACSNDSVIVACNIDGKFTHGFTYSWDTTSFKPAQLVRQKLLVMQNLARKHMVTAAKDISMPGTLGTLAMLLESSGMGAVVDIDKIPIPPRVPLIQWLRAYQGCGFILTCKRGKETAILSKFEKSGISAATVGRIKSDRKLIIESKGKEAILFDFKKDSITGKSTSARHRPLYI